jgi:hypothetical protein
MTPDVSPSCDVGARERCPGCACGCHTKDSPGAGPGHRIAGAGSLLLWGPDRRLLVQALSAAIPGVTVLALLVYCIVLASQGLL